LCAASAAWYPPAMPESMFLGFSMKGMASDICCMVGPRATAAADMVSRQIPPFLTDVVSAYTWRAHGAASAGAPKFAPTERGPPSQLPARGIASPSGATSQRPWLLPLCSPRASRHSPARHFWLVRLCAAAHRGWSRARAGPPGRRRTPPPQGRARRSSRA
jgi:hypothetical protein